MTILYALVARGNTVLAEYTFTSGNFPTITRVLLGKIPEQDGPRRRPRPVRPPRPKGKSMDQKLRERRAASDRDSAGDSARGSGTS